jgi:hypothetical protein
VSLRTLCLRTPVLRVLKSRPRPRALPRCPFAFLARRAHGDVLRVRDEVRWFSEVGGRQGEGEEGHGACGLSRNPERRVECGGVGGVVW